MYINASYHSLRRLLGQLGLLLPPTLWLINERSLESSISHFYYTQAGTVFTGVLIAFGLFLFTYRGHTISRSKSKEWVSDNLATNIAGFFAIMTALVPTSLGVKCPEITASSVTSIYCHNDSLRNYLHLGFAGTFLFIMGWMSIFKFTLSENKMFNHLYRVAGYIVWVSILAMLVFIVKGNQDAFPTAVFWGETIALTAFGISWLVKGKVSKMPIVAWITK